MIAALWVAVSLAGPAVLTVDPAAPSAPLEGRLAGKDARDAKDRPYDAWVVEAPANTWVEVTVRDYAFPIRVRVGDQEPGFPAYFRDPAVVRAWSTGEPLELEVGTTDKAVLGTYTASLALIAPAVSEPPPVDRLPPYATIEPTSWADGGWFCDLVTARFPTARAFTVSVHAEDTGRTRLLVGRWEDGRLRVEQDALPPEGSHAPAPFDVRFEPDAPRVFGVCRDGLGKAYLDVRTPEDQVAPGAVIDPSRRTATLDEAAAVEQATLEGRMTLVGSENGEASRFEPLVVPLFLQSGAEYEAVALTEADAYVPVALLYLAYCDATCAAFAARAGMAMTMDGSWTVLALPDVAEKQAWGPPHTERWQFAWPEGTSLTAMLHVYVPSVAPQRVRVAIGER